MTRGDTRLHAVTRGYTRSHAATGTRLHAAPCGYLRLRAATGGYLRLRAVTGGYLRLPAVTCGYGRLQELEKRKDFQLVLETTLVEVQGNSVRHPSKTSPKLLPATLSCAAEAVQPKPCTQRSGTSQPSRSS